MKKIGLILSMVLLSTSLLLADDVNYVTTTSGTFFYKNVRYGLKCCLICKTSDGQSVKFKKDDILSYCKNGETFEKMPVYKNNIPTGEQEFMKVVCLKNGLKLYEYEYISKYSNSKSRRYYVFKGNHYYLEMDDFNKKSLTAFFQAK